MDVKLSKYIQQAHSQGMSVSEIKEALIKAGWNESEVQRALDSRFNTKVSATVQMTEKSKKKTISKSRVPTSSNNPQNKNDHSVTMLVITIIVVVLTIIGGVFVGYYIVNKYLQSNEITFPSVTDSITPTSIPTTDMVPTSSIISTEPIDEGAPTPTVSYYESVPTGEIPNNNGNETSSQVTNTPIPMPTAGNDKFVSLGSQIIEDGISATVISASESGQTIIANVEFTNTSTTEQSVQILRLSMLSETHGTANNENYVSMNLNPGETRSLSLTYDQIPNSPYRFVYTTVGGVSIELGQYLL